MRTRDSNIMYCYVFIVEGCQVERRHFEELIREVVYLIINLFTYTLDILKISLYFLFSIEIKTLYLKYVPNSLYTYN